MSKSCKLPDCYPTSVNNFNLDDTFQNVNSEATFYSLDSDGNEMDSVSLTIGSYDTDSLNAVGINPPGIYRIDIPSNMNVTLYSENNFEGDSEVFYSNTSNLVDRNGDLFSLVIGTGSEPSEPNVITTPRIAPANNATRQMSNNTVSSSIINSNIISKNVPPPPPMNVLPAPRTNNIPLINNNIPLTNNYIPPMNNYTPPINNNIVPPKNNYITPVTTNSRKEAADTNSVITNQMKSDRWINGISNTTVIIIIFILLLIIILKK